MIKFITKSKNFNENYVNQLYEYIDYLESCKRKSTFDQEEDLIFLPDHKSDLPKLEKHLSEFTEKDYQFIIFVGIGGANLGVQTVYDALHPETDVYFIENIDPDYNYHIQNEIYKRYKSGQKALFICASKSGATTETMSNFSFFLAKFQDIEPNWKKRTLISTVENSNLDKIAKKLDLKIIYTHELLVDRYCVFGLGSIFSLSLIGVNIKELIRGANEINHALLEKDTEKNISLRLALELFENYQSGLNIYNVFIFSNLLTTFGRWMRQILAESLGKSGKGITPIYSTGTIDLHSMTQLYLDGPKSFFTTFVELEKFNQNDITDPGNILDGTEVEKIGKRTHTDLMAVILNSVKKAYDKQELKYNELILQKLDAYHLGQLLQIYMLTTIYLGKLLNVNPFNQDAVELYKSEIRNQL